MSGSETSARDVVLYMCPELAGYLEAVLGDKDDPPTGDPTYQWIVVASAQDEADGVALADIQVARL